MITEGFPGRHSARTGCNIGGPWPPSVGQARSGSSFRFQSLLFRQYTTDGSRIISSFIPRVFGLTLCALTAFPAWHAVAQESVPSILDGPYFVPRLAERIELDGQVEEAAWQSVPVLPMAMHWPSFGLAPTARTEIRIAYDDTYLYVSGRCFDDPALVQIPSLKRDGIGMTMDQVTIGLDTFSDNENLLAFAVSAAGSRSDLLISNDAQGPAAVNSSWDAFWDAASARTDWGWSTEIRIPFSSLRYQVKDEEVQMGFIVYRYIARSVEMAIFPPIPPDWGFWSFMKPSQSHPIVFTDVPVHNPVYATPYVVTGLGQEYALNEQQNAYQRDDSPAFDIGFDLKYGLTNNLTLDVTANTDFAQVEADNEEVNLTRFSLFFPEKRRFFQERSSNFEFGFGGSNGLFYSRRIGLREGEQVRLLGGARMVGRERGWDIGLLNMQSARHRGQSAENYGVVRLRRQVFNPYSYLGGITTTRVAEDGTYNVGVGLDGIFRLFGEDYLALNVAQTLDSELDTRVGSLDPVRVRAMWERRTVTGLGYGFSFHRSGSTYVPGLGFELREDFTGFGDRISYGWVPSTTSRFQRYRVLIEGNATLRNSDGTLETAAVGPGMELYWKGGSTFEASALATVDDLREPFSLSDEAEVAAGRYTFYQLKARQQTPRGRLLRAVNTLQAGSFYDGGLVSVGTNPIWELSRHLSLDAFYQFNQVSFSDRDQSWTAHVARLRIEAALNTRVSSSVFIQYSSGSDAGLVNVRFRYNPREGTDFYLVYNEGVNTDRFGVMPALPLTSSRTILAKYSHTLLF